MSYVTYIIAEVFATHSKDSSPDSEVATIYPINEVHAKLFNRRLRGALPITPNFFPQNRCEPPSIYLVVTH